MIFSRLSSLLQNANAFYPTQGSYAGWATARVLAELPCGADVRTLKPLTEFLETGGPLAEYESRLAFLIDAKSLDDLRRERYLALAQDPSPPESVQGQLVASKLAELDDPHFRLCGRGEILPVGTAAEPRASQGTAYVVSAAAEALLDRIGRIGPELLDAKDALRRIERARRILSDNLAKPLRRGDAEPEDLLWTLRCFGDPIALAAADRMEKGAYDVHLCQDDEFEAMLKGRVKVTERDFGIFQKDYYGFPAILLRSNAASWRMAGWSSQFRAFSIVGNYLHEDDHSIRQEDFLSAELLAHGIEVLWRAEQGNVDRLKEFFEDSPLGFALSFRDYFEKFYSTTWTAAAT